MKRILVAVVLALLLAVPALAQPPSGFAFAVFVGSLPFDPPITVTETGIRDQFLVLCYRPSDRFKSMAVVQVDIPDNSPLATHRTLITDVVVAACGQVGITVPRAAVLFPAFQQGA